LKTGVVSRMRLLGGTATIAPNDLLIPSLDKEIGTTTITGTSQPAVGVANDGPLGVIQIAKDVAASWWLIVNDLVLVLVAGDKGRGVGNRLALDFLNEVS
jgi:hypothetical protein